MATRIHLEIFLVVFVPLVLTAGLTDLKEEPSNFKSEYLKPPLPVKLTKFSFTQKGYIQFLRYITPVPPIGDFTFCIWMRSTNLSYAHPLLSYSRHEEERLIRAWITPGGEEARLALREIDVIKIPVGLKENQWYHICMSWSTKTGHWDFFLNGKLRSHGYNAKARGQLLSKDGDIVVGQEYTDFDKGLDDGIEGDVSGFNMILASTTATHKTQRYPKEPSYSSSSSNSNRRVSIPMPHKIIKGHYIVNSEPLVIRRRVSKSLGDDLVSSPSVNNNTSHNETLESDVSSRQKRQSIHGFPLSYFRVMPIIPRERLVKYYYPNTFAQSYQNIQFQHSPEKIRAPLFTSSIRNINSRISNEIIPQFQKPLGLRLVELSFNCEYGRGAPIKAKEMLVSWTKTPVRVFGGAILKKVDPFCYESYIKTEL